MSDLPVDLRGVLRGLHDHHVEYALNGAVAMVFYGYVRNTEDLDIVVNPVEENLDRVGDWLRSNRRRAEAESGAAVRGARALGHAERFECHGPDVAGAGGRSAASARAAGMAAADRGG